MREVLSLREKQKLTFMEKIKETIEVAREKDPAAKGAINIPVRHKGITNAYLIHLDLTIVFLSMKTLPPAKRTV